VRRRIEQGSHHRFSDPMEKRHSHRKRSEHKPTSLEKQQPANPFQ
jgi:hypothetical protein